MSSEPLFSTLTSFVSHMYNTLVHHLIQMTELRQHPGLGTLSNAERSPSGIPLRVASPLLQVEEVTEVAEELAGALWHLTREVQPCRARTLAADLKACILACAFVRAVQLALGCLTWRVFAPSPARARMYDVKDRRVGVVDCLRKYTGGCGRVLGVAWPQLSRPSSH